MADLILELGCEVIVVAANRLGTINHTLLTVNALCQAKIRRLKVALMQHAVRDSSCRTNAGVLSRLLAPLPVLSIGFLGTIEPSPQALKRIEKKCKKVLARLLA